LQFADNGGHDVSAVADAETGDRILRQKKDSPRHAARTRAVVCGTTARVSPHRDG